MSQPNRESAPDSVTRSYSRLAWAAYLCMAGLCAIEAWRPLTAGSDFWSHAAIGGWIWRHGAVPHRTLFLWSAHLPWVYHSWLPELVSYFVLAACGESWGPRVALGALVLTVTATYSIPWALWRRNGAVTWLTSLVFLLAIHGGNQRFQARPEALSALLFAALLVYLVQWRSLPSDLPARAALRTPRVWGVLGLFAFWANCHPGFVWGLIMLGIAAFFDLIQDRGNPKSRLLFALFIGCVIAANLNPNTWRLWGVVLHPASLTFHSIGEWRPVYVAPYEPFGFLSGVLICVALAMVAWAGGERRWAHLVWILFTTGSYLVARRNSELCGLTALVVMAASAGQLDLVGRLRFVSASLSWVVAFAYAVLGWHLRPDPRMLGAVVPVQLAEFVQSVPASIPVFNDYDGSDYLEWRCQGAPRLFVDAVNAYPDSVFQEYLDVTAVNSRGRALLAGKRYGVIALIHQPGDSTSVALENYLSTDRQWKLLFGSYEGTVWGNAKYLAPAGPAAAGRRLAP